VLPAVSSRTVAHVFTGTDTAPVAIVVTVPLTRLSSRPCDPLMLNP
jgi:hypothetical protein